MNTLLQKDFTTTRALEYHYYVSEAWSADPLKPALVFLHGWPDSSALWTSIVPAFLADGYRIFVPDLLGFGGTSKPTDTKLFAFAHQAKDIVEVCEHEGIKSILPIAHGLGSAVASSLYQFHPERVVGLVFITVGYRLPRRVEGKVSLADAEAAKGKCDGYSRWEYTSFFTAPDTPKI